MNLSRFLLPLIYCLLCQSFPSKAFSAGTDSLIYGELLDSSLKVTPIKKDKKFKKLGLVKWELQNGVQVFLKPNSSTGDGIVCTGISPGGHSLYPDSLFRNGDIAAFLIRKSGVGQYSLPELEKLLGNRNVQVIPYIGELFEGFQASSSRQEFRTMLELIYLYFEAPRADRAHFESFIRGQTKNFSDMQDSPFYQFTSIKNKIKYDGHPRQATATPESISTIQLPVAYKIFRDRFSDANDFTFIIVGNFELAAIKDELSAFLGNLSTKAGKEKWENVGAGLKPGFTDTTIYIQQVPQSLVEIVYHGSFNYSFAEAYLFNTLLESFEAQLTNLLKEEKGTTFNLAVKGNFERIPSPAYAIEISLACRPTQTEELTELIENLIKRFQTSQFNEKAIEAIKGIQLENRKRNTERNAYWIEQLSDVVKHEDAIKSIRLRQYSKAQQSLTASSLKKAAIRYFSKENYLRIVLKPTWMKYRDQ